jgi:integrase
VTQTTAQRRRTKVPGAANARLYQRTTADGHTVYEVMWRDQDRKQRFRTVEGGIMAARAERDRIVGAHAKGEQVQANPRLTFGEGARRLLESIDTRDLNERTKSNYRVVLERHLLPRWHSRRLDSITGDDLTRLLSELRIQGLGERSCGTALALVGRVFRHAARHLGWAGKDPTTLLERHERPKPTQDRKRTIFHDQELEQTIVGATEPARTLFKLLAGTGCRISEALALQWDDLYLDADDPRVAFRGQVNRKGERQALKRRDNGVERVVPIPEGLAQALRNHVAHACAPGEYVFATSSGRPLGQRNVARSLRAAQMAARKPDGTPTYPALHEDGQVSRGTVPGLHSFRHTAASRFLYAGDTADEVASLLGHADATVTRALYLHEIESAERRAIRRDKIDQQFGAVFA